jgi:selenide,water dikinase
MISESASFPNRTKSPKPLTLFSCYGGCAAKVGPQQLDEILAPLFCSNSSTAALLRRKEDAGTWPVSDTLHLVQSVDVITPISDDPYKFGSIAAAHALSDIFAKGARPMTGLVILGLPFPDLSTSVASMIVQGVIDKLVEAGAEPVGGHTICSPQLECGVSVTGVVEGAMILNQGCQPGDALILTKPLGTGIIASAVKMVNSGVVLRDITPPLIDECETSMLTLNDRAAQGMLNGGASACTDVSGFGFVGHLLEMLGSEGLVAEIDFSKIPLLPGAIQLAEQMIVSNGCDRNYIHWVNRCKFDCQLSQSQRLLLFDPQTSGGLLFSIPEKSVNRTLNLLWELGVEHAAQVGRVQRNGVPGVVIHA